MEEQTAGPSSAAAKKLKIAQIGIVVEDASRTARHYAEIFGMGPWLFRDLTPTDGSLRGEVLGNAGGCFREAVTAFNDIEIKLIEPLYGPGAYMEFLRKHGGGIHHLSLGAIDDNDTLISGLQKAGIGIEMRGHLGGAHVFTCLDAVRELGTRFEVMQPALPGATTEIEPWGFYEPPAPPLWNMEKKRINQIGFVVDDAEAMAKRYEELLGIGPWRIVLTNTRRPAGAPKRKGPSKAILHGIPMIEMDLRLKIALADCDDMQFELIEPLAGPGTHWEFLKKQGNGVHHLSFGRVNDHDHCIGVLQQRGIDIEMSGPGGPGSRFFYMSTQKELGTVFEFVSVPPPADAGT
ncbi:MAG: VOC family protein [Deltaproteobacteria bacterium]|nr:VOC family protein [Deltaproteobacteria bacterium]